MTKTIFIDGSAGTTGLQIVERLQKSTINANIITLKDDERKDSNKRSQAINDSDITILCLPDEAAIEAVSLVKNEHVKILDASSAHRTKKGWVYGLPEHNPMQAQMIAKNRWVTNPGCYPTGAILLLAPLMRHQLLGDDYPLWVHGVSGYSGGGRSLIEQYEQQGATNTASPYSPYGLHLAHKHVPEMHFYALLKHAPIFTPAVGNFYNGMLVSIALHGEILQDKGLQLQALYQETYKTYKNVIIPPNNDGIDTQSLAADAFKNTDDIELRVFHNTQNNHVLLTARYDNLGKGAAGAAIQNLELMLSS